jgi:hypothetical protein
MSRRHEFRYFVSHQRSEYWGKGVDLFRFLKKRLWEREFFIEECSLWIFHTTAFSMLRNEVRTDPACSPLRERLRAKGCGLEWIQCDGIGPDLRFQVFLAGCSCIIVAALEFYRDGPNWLRITTNLPSRIGGVNTGSVKDWLEAADRWDTWIEYRAVPALSAGFAEFFLATCALKWDEMRESWILVGAPPVAAAVP